MLPARASAHQGRTALIRDVSGRAGRDRAGKVRSALVCGRRLTERGGTGG